jgi:hypothetical protein
MILTRCVLFICCLFHIQFTFSKKGQNITQLLHSAGLALKILTTSRSVPSSGQPIANHRDDFQNATDAYLKTLQSVDVRLRRQIMGLEEADIIVGEKKERSEQEAKAAGKDENDLDGGTGKLDIGWLNSRSGRVERDNEAKLWARARKFLEGLEDRAETGASTEDILEGKADGDGDHSMDD